MVFVFFLATLCGLWDLSSSTRDSMLALAALYSLAVKAKSQPLDCQGISKGFPGGASGREPAC